MRRAAEAGSLTIIAGINSACVESSLARITLRRLQREHPGKLRVHWSELPLNTPVPAPPPEKSMSRGEHHRAARTSYELADRLRAEVLLQALSDESSELADPQKDNSLVNSDSLIPQLQDNGIRHAFGFLYTDANGNVHPFHGRQHLCVLVWALSD